MDEHRVQQIYDCIRQAGYEGGMFWEEAAVKYGEGAFLEGPDKFIGVFVPVPGATKEMLDRARNAFEEGRKQRDAELEAEFQEIKGQNDKHLTDFLHKVPVQYVRHNAKLLTETEEQTRNAKLVSYALQVKTNYLKMTPDQRKVFLDVLTADNKEGGWRRLFELEDALRTKYPDPAERNEALIVGKMAVKAITTRKDPLEAIGEAREKRFQIEQARNRVESALEKYAVPLPSSSEQPKQLTVGSGTRALFAKRTNIPADEVIRLYTEGLSIRAIARQLNCSFGAVWNRLEAAGVQRRPSGGRAF